LSTTTPTSPSPRKTTLVFLFTLLLTLFILVLSDACSSGGGFPAGDSAYPPASLSTGVPVQASQTPTRTAQPDGSLAPSARPSATSSPSPTASPTPTLTPLPTFTTPLLHNSVIPAEYIDEPCEYLRMRWSPTSSPPHTVVVPVMFHHIYRSSASLNGNQDITARQFNDIMAHAESLGFETITTAELEGFLYGNARIPPRSMLLILDDRRPNLISEYFMPVLEANDWTLTLGWISADNGYGLWHQMETLHATGRLDFQSHGYRHRYARPDTPFEEVLEELQAPIPILEEHFGVNPIAYIWPGGHYTQEAIQAARQAGYRLGFTVHSSMPIRFNWIPLSPAPLEMNDPLMLLPRAWSHDAILKLDQAVEVSEQAEIFAIQNYPLEAAWYRRACRGVLPPLKAVYPEISQIP
jgi:peptidoglycan/xylan/chitin deacetylase (PgdA/CDA1 family)